jgi:predicted DNA-binding transcriptional regulator AlpA
MTEILTVREVAALLKMTEGQVYSLTKSRFRARHGEARAIPALRINGNLRFRLSDIEAWLDRLSREEQ